MRADGKRSGEDPRLTGLRCAEHTRLEARAISHRHADVVEVLSAALVEHRTIDAAMIDDTISRAIDAR